MILLISITIEVGLNYFFVFKSVLIFILSKFLIGSVL